MKLRKITPDEFITMQNNMNIAFRFERTETPVDSNNESDFCYGAYTDDGIMTSSVIANPYKCCYWGQDVGMCGVGGVATFPEYRREGHMRHLLPFVLKAAYDRGDVLSSLFPFSHPFYRKFGFECGHPVQYMDFGMEAFKLAFVGAAVFTAVTWIFTSMTDRLSSGPAAKAAPIFSAVGIFLASQALMGMIL